MTTREELHDLVNRLDEQAAAQALAYLRDVLAADAAGGEILPADHRGVSAVSGRDFFAPRPHRVPTLPPQRGGTAAVSFDDLLGDFWPEDETADEFIAALRAWRGEGAHA